jgi:hypothetical protein
LTRCESCLARIARNSGDDGPASWAWSQPCTCDRLRQEEYGPSALTMRALELEAIRVRAMVKGGKITPDTEDE